MTLFSKETISSQTPFLKMILYLMILIKKSRKLEKGEFYDVSIVDSQFFDLIAEI